MKGNECIAQKGLLHKLTKDYIHKNLSYRFVPFNSDDSHLVVQRLEKQIQSGALGLVPTLNGNVPIKSAGTS